MVLSRSDFSSPADPRECLLCSPDSLGMAPGAWKNVETDGTDAMPNATQSWLNGAGSGLVCPMKARVKASHCEVIQK